MAASFKQTSDRVLEKVRDVLTAGGYNEALCPSLIPAKWSDSFSPWTDQAAISSSQPMLGVLEKGSQNIGAVDLLRRSLVPSLLEARRINEARSNQDIDLFETSKVYLGLACQRLFIRSLSLYLWPQFELTLKPRSRCLPVRLLFAICCSRLHRKFQLPIPSLKKSNQKRIRSRLGSTSLVNIAKIGDPTQGQPNSSAKSFRPLKVLLVIFVRILTAAGGILFSVVIVQESDLSTLGIFAVATSACNFAIILAKGGMGVSYLRAGSRMQSGSESFTQGPIFWQIQKAVFIRGCLLAIPLSIGIYWYLSSSSTAPLISAVCLALSVIAGAALGIVSEHYKSKSLVDVAMLLTPGIISFVSAVIVKSLSVFGFLSNGLSLNGVVVVFSMVYLAITMMALLAVYGKDFLNAKQSEGTIQAGLDLEQRQQVEQEIKTAGSRFLKINLLTYGSFNGLFLLAAFIFSGSDLGMIRLAERLAAPVLIILSIINPLIAARLSQLYGASKIAELRQMTWNVSKVCVALTFLMVSTMLIGLPYFLNRMFGDQEINIWLIVIMLLGNAVNLSFGPLGMVLSMANREAQLQSLSQVTMLIAVFLCLVLSYSIGAYGFCLAIAISLAVKNLLMYSVYSKELKA